MNDKMTDQNKEVEIDLTRLWKALLNKAWLIAIVAVSCAVVTLLGTLLFVTPKYQSSIMLYVNNSSDAKDGASGSISSSDISASRNLVKTYIIILNTKETLDQVVEYAGVDRTYAEIRSMISAGAVDSTEIIEIAVTSEDAAEAERIANAIAYVLPQQIDSIVYGTSAKVVAAAVQATRPSSPSFVKNTIAGFLIGFFITVVVIVLREAFDVTVRTEEDVLRSCQHPILASVPDMEAQGKGGHYYGYGNTAFSKAALAANGGRKTIGPDISFAASEAYKVLRTKLLFSFTDEKSCHIIGISSAMTGEGKSLTAVNLAYTLSQLGKRVLLIDCDMRRPSVADKLPVRKHPGLSDYLSGQAGSESLIQLCGIKGDEGAFHVISAGRIPPNPMELLGSAKMERTLTTLQENYDYILLDLPPVGEVGDAIAIAKLTDGILMVVRRAYAIRSAVSAAAREFEFVGAKILGVVYNGTIEESGAYGKSYYKKYGYSQTGEGGRNGRKAGKHTAKAKM